MLAMRRATSPLKYVYQAEAVTEKAGLSFTAFDGIIESLAGTKRAPPPGAFFLAASTSSNASKSLILLVFRPNDQACHYADLKHSLGTLLLSIACREGALQS